MLFNKLRRDLDALAGKLADVVNSFVAQITKHSIRIQNLEEITKRTATADAFLLDPIRPIQEEIAQLRKELNMEKAARTGQAMAINEHFRQVEEKQNKFSSEVARKLSDFILDDLDDGEDGETWDEMDDSELEWDGCGNRQCKVCNPPDAVPCKMSVVDRKAANEAFEKAYTEIKTEVEKERKMKKAKKGRKGKKS